MPMITVNKFGTFWIVYCADCAWRSDPTASWQEAEAFRFSHACPLEPVLRIEYVPHITREDPIAV
jgi:hypothetical protein